MNSGGVPFTVSEVFHLWTRPGVNSAGDASAPATSSASCFVDESCYDSQPDVHHASSATAYLIFQDHVCSGVLLNDRNSTGTPYLLTAGHCVRDNQDAQFMLAIFSYRTSVCSTYANTTPPIGDYLPAQQAGAGLLLTRDVHEVAGTNTNEVYLDTPDFALVKLGETPEVPYVMAGWNSQEAPLGEAVLNISHPHALPQVLARGTIFGAPAIDFFRVNWTQGAVDHGSSGSGAFGPDGKVTGVFSNGNLPTDPSQYVCDLGTSYSGNFTRFSSIYPFVKDWLEDTTTYPAPPSFLREGITNAASYQYGLVIGELATIFGSNLSSAKGIVVAQSFPLPYELAGAHVEINGVKAPLLAVANVNGQEQINLQVPWEFQAQWQQGLLPLVTVTVTNANGGASSRTGVLLDLPQPGIFTDSNGYGAALHGLDNRPVTVGDPAAPGEIIALFLTGLGVVQPAQQTGHPAPALPLANTQFTPIVQFGEVAGDVSYSGLAPGWVGLYQINVRVPASAPSGDNLVTVMYFSALSNAAKVPVR